ncbi:transcriptional regulator GcvA [Sphingomonas nostoxanthinifaciens]|uniref:transcriptional regulator GcvA n=1 Tax=Sphingomonas nostoxanthinifaciens TaxID=2872652 RepID=UPI001CC1EA96|nr:transcriptional regulator GcvA [Sphingomonas nostoxanthinifaciens]UAK23773.1 transcriptional regulator GcvA [Sphingomonas nostoxanthinifaciens]
MRRRLLPSLTALRTFEAVARLMSFTEAAAELNVTQSAASRQVRALEQFLGLALFTRGKRQLELTEEGLTYSATVRDALDGIEMATLQMMANERGGGVLTINALPTFAMRWLIPRLASFAAAHPLITVNLVSGDGPLILWSQNEDVALRYGNGDWPEQDVYRLGLTEEMVVVCSPDLRTGPTPLDTPEGLRGHVLLQHSTRPGAWPQWLASTGLADIAPSGPIFEHFFMVIQAAVAGLGAALLPRFLIEEELRSGALVVPFATTTIYDGGYYLICPRGRSDLPKVRAFREWLLAASLA